MTGQVTAQRTALGANARRMRQRTNRFMSPIERSDLGSESALHRSPWIVTACRGRIRGTMISIRFGLVLLVAASCCTESGAAQPPKAAVFDLELIDTSQESERGERADQTARI